MLLDVATVLKESPFPGRGVQEFDEVLIAEASNLRISTVAPRLGREYLGVGWGLQNSHERRIGLIYRPLLCIPLHERPDIKDAHEASNSRGSALSAARLS
jgi:hypothetical protein